MRSTILRCVVVICVALAVVGAVVLARHHWRSPAGAPEPAAAPAQMPPPSKPLPPEVRRSLDAAFRNDWACASAVRVEKHLVLSLDAGSGSGDYREGWAVVMDPGQHIVLAAEAHDVTCAKLSQVVDLDGDRHADAILETYSGGAHAATDYYLCSFYPTFRLLAGFDANNTGIHEVRDLNRDGRMEIITDDDSFAYFDGLSYAGSPRLPMILGLKYGRYVDATRDFPELIRADMRRAAAHVKEVTAAMARPDADSMGAFKAYAAAIQWLGDAVLLNEEGKAYAEILQVAHPKVRELLAPSRPAVIETVLGRDRKLSYEAPQIGDQ
jgi:hypothetical protein